MKKLIGNEHIKKILQTKSGSRSFLIEGCTGSGRHTLLDILIMSRICELEGLSPCGACGACRRYESGNCVDIVYVDATLPVSEFRKVLSSAAEYPKKEKYKFYVIDNCDDMKVQNQNALLKNLEEPLDFVYFALICVTKESLLKTVVSRCTVLSMKPLQDHEIKKYLTDKYGSEDEEALAYAVANCGGFFGKAKNLYENHGEYSDKRYSEFVEALLAENPAGMFRAVSFDGKKREDFNEFINILLSRIKNILICVGYGEDETRLSPEEREVVSLGEKRIKNIYNALVRTKQGIKYNVNIPLWSVYIVKECLKKI